MKITILGKGGQTQISAMSVGQATQRLILAFATVPLPDPSA